MDINKGAVGIFVALCVIGGAAGFYLATTGGPRPALDAASSTLALDSTAQPLEQPTAIVPRQKVPAAPAPPAAGIEPRVALSPRPAAPARRPQPAATWGQSTPTPAENPRRFPSADERRPASPVTATDAGRTFDAEPVAAAEPAPPQFVELVVPAESVIGLQMETALTSERARVEDDVLARVTRDVRVDERVAIPSGASVHGHVTLVERGGRLRERARLGIRFTSVVLADGTRIPLETDTIYREGTSPGGESTAKIGGGAIGGAIIGGILGGAKGAMIGGSVGAGAGTAAVYAGGRNAATLPSGTPITVRLVEPASVTVEY
ncbi:MAG: hypothetical protein ACRD3C_25065 [Vicinamibacterales bacterium]